MGESQSRYSIVERLTTRKLEIMNSKSKLKENVTAKEQHIGKLKKELTNWKKDIKEDVIREEKEKELDIEREERKRELEIEKASQEYTNAQGQKSDKESVFDEQLEAIEKALKSIEEISKTSPTTQ